MRNEAKGTVADQGEQGLSVSPSHVGIPTRSGLCVSVEGADRMRFLKNFL